MPVFRFASLIAIVLSAVAATSPACPLCESIGTQTLSEQINESQIAVIGRLLEITKPKGNPQHIEPVTQAVLHIDDVIKGKLAKGHEKIMQLAFSRAANPGEMFLITGITKDEKTQWSAPIRLTKQSQVYVKCLAALTEKGAERLGFFQPYLEHGEELLASDAYDEFARAPYAEITAFKDRIDRQQLIKWIKSPDMPATRKRLYLMMLSACGTQDEVPLLEELLRQKNRKVKAGFDSVIACYLTLTGSDGLQLVEQLFLRDPDASYIDTYATIMALRFHITETDVMPRARILASLRLILDRPKMADLVIPDLARSKDWSAMDQLVAMFKDTQNVSSWSRIPIINYLRACPLPAAQQHLAELKQIAPDAFLQADTLFPFQEKKDK